MPPAEAEAQHRLCNEPAVPCSRQMQQQLGRGRVGRVGIRGSCLAAMRSRGC